MAKAPSFNLTEEAKRGQYIVYADISEQSGTWSASSAIWEPQGYRTESAGKDFNFEKTDIVDVIDIAHSNIKSGAGTITFEPNPIRPGLRYGRFTEIIHEQAWRKQVTALSNHKFLEVATYITPTGGGFYAKVYDACSVLPQNQGGDGGGSLGLSYEATFAGQEIFGSVDKALPPLGEELTTTGVVFTPEV